MHTYIYARIYVHIRGGTSSSNTTSISRSLRSIPFFLSYFYPLAPIEESSGATRASRESVCRRIHDGTHVCTRARACTYIIRTHVRIVSGNEYTERETGGDGREPDGRRSRVGRSRPESTCRRRHHRRRRRRFVRFSVSHLAPQYSRRASSTPCDVV